MNTDKHGLDQKKGVLRSDIRSVLKHLPPEKQAADSLKIRALLSQQPFWKTAAAVLFFAPLSNEVDVWPLLNEKLAAGKIAALPRFDSGNQSYTACRVRNLQSEIVMGQFGIREPSAGCPPILPRDLDLILVPAIAFDPDGHRLGRGKGFYDRLLAGVSGVKCGMAFDEQLVKAVPAGTLDVRMNFIVTPTRCIKM
jgi:5-formyltetrahydrofolate cyclo-ligase